MFRDRKSKFRPITLEKKGKLDPMFMFMIMNHVSCTKELSRVHDDFNLPLPPPILVNLGVERDGPGDEINPSNDIADDVQRLVVGDGNQDKGILGAEEVDE